MADLWNYAGDKAEVLRAKLRAIRSIKDRLLQVGLPPQRLESWFKSQGLSI